LTAGRNCARNLYTPATIAALKRLASRRQALGCRPLDPPDILILDRSPTDDITPDLLWTDLIRHAL